MDYTAQLFPALPTDAHFLGWAADDMLSLEHPEIVGSVPGGELRVPQPSEDMVNFTPTDTIELWHTPSQTLGARSCLILTLNCGFFLYSCFVLTFCAAQVSAQLRSARGVKRSHAAATAGSANRYSCTMCLYSTDRIQSLKKHELTHTGEKPFTCDQCTFATKQASNLARHKRTHTGDQPFRCLQCSYATTQSTNLERHMRVHSGDRPYQGTHCAYSAKDSSTLKSHMRTHTGEKPFQCTMCPARMRDASNLTRHLAVVHMQKPCYKCDVCPYIGFDEAALLTHTINKHRR